MRHFLIAVLAATLAAACSERPPRADPEPSASYNLGPAANAMAERTVGQGESRRMGD
jgi:hypothetical protein